MKKALTDKQYEAAVNKLVEPVYEKCIEKCDPKDKKVFSRLFIEEMLKAKVEAGLNSPANLTLFYMPVIKGLAA